MSTDKKFQLFHDFWQILFMAMTRSSTNDGKMWMNQDTEKKSNGTEIVPKYSWILYFLKQLQKLIHKLLGTWNPFTVNCKQFPWFVTTKIKFDQINPLQNDFKSLDLCGTSHRHRLLTTVSQIQHWPSTTLPATIHLGLRKFDHTLNQLCHRLCPVAKWKRDE